MPAAQPGELYALSSMDLAGVNEVSMCRYRGKVALVVNTASQCGYTPEYGPLQTIYEKYKAQGFVVLGFPSGSFNQELDSGVAVSEFCTKTYGITFPMFAISNVNPPNENPIYTWLKAQPGSGAGGAYSAAIPWNFEKWLVSRKGVVVNRFNYTVYPDTTDVTTAVEAELSK